MGAAVLANGCAVFDPAPYSPTRDQNLPDAPHLNVVGANLEDAATKSQTLSDGYADARDTIMR
jgi:hypothetical protein